jgi:hypothetical protein
MKKSILLLLLTSAGSIFYLTGCSKYIGHTNNRILVPGHNQELVFEDMRWEQTPDSAIATIDLDKISKNLSSTDIKSVTVKKNGFESIAQYLNWGRDNLYKYEIVNDRILLYWKMEDSFYALSQPVTIIVRLK